MTMKHMVIIVNGAPRAGKDTLVKFMKDHMNRRNIPATDFSSIDPVRNMLSQAGIDVSRKTPEDRKLLAEIGNLVQEHSNFRSERCINTAVCFSDGFDTSATFLHIREPEIITAVTAVLKNRGFYVARVLVKSKRADTKFSNSTDASTAAMTPDFIVYNDDTLGMLYDKAEFVVTQCIDNAGGEAYLEAAE